MKELFELIEKLIAQKFYGSVELKMEAGRIVLIRKTESIKPENLK